jgi:hypothetical protein
MSPPVRLPVPPLERRVQEFWAHFDAKDYEALLALMTEDAIETDDLVVKDAGGNVVMDGSGAVRARYAKSMSENPDIHYDTPNRISLGAFVLDEERVTGFTKQGSAAEMRAVLIYRFSGELIQEITVLT